MAKPKKTLKDLLNSMAGKGEKKNGEAKIGEYAESTGGGTPMKKGEKIDYHAKTAKEAQAYRAQHPGEVVRVDQPRDKDGQFTYNSVNAKPLEYGPSRGKTVPPFLEGFNITFAKKSGKGALVDLDGKKYTLPDKFKTKEDFLKACREYKEKEGLEGFGGNFGDAVKGKGGKTGKVVLIEKGTFKEKASIAKGNIDKIGGMDNITKPKDNAPKNNPFDEASKDLEGFKKTYAKEIKDLSDMLDAAGYEPSEVLSDDFWTTTIKSFEDIDSFDKLKQQLSEALE